MIESLPSSTRRGGIAAQKQPEDAAGDGTTAPGGAARGSALPAFDALRSGSAVGSGNSEAVERQRGTRRPSLPSPSTARKTSTASPSVSPKRKKRKLKKVLYFNASDVGAQLKLFRPDMGNWFRAVVVGVVATAALSERHHHVLRLVDAHGTEVTLDMSAEKYKVTVHPLQPAPHTAPSSTKSSACRRGSGDLNSRAGSTTRAGGKGRLSSSTLSPDAIELRMSLAASLLRHTTQQGAPPQAQQQQAGGGVMQPNRRRAPNRFLAAPMY